MPQLPPTTSGIVIISGSYGFDPDLSDFPITLSNLVSTGRDYTSDILMSFRVTDSHALTVISGLPNYDLYPYPAQLVTTGRDYLDSDDLIVSSPFNSLDFVFPDDQSIETTPTTTSGIVLWSFFPGAGVAFVVPFVINARLFPIFAGTYPEQDRRIYPVLPQFSTIVIP